LPRALIHSILCAMTSSTLTPQAFVDKWRHATLKERSACQEHFIDLCRLIRHPTPAEVDPTGENFAVEYGAAKTGGGQGFADVFKRSYFALEYKGKHADLDKAYQQLLQYREALQNPPLLVVCDIDRIVIHTNFTNTSKRTRTLTNLYNQRPTWLDNAHRKLDEAVFAAHGWPIDLSDDEILARLLALNLARARK
jgi:hypothetical protein